MMRSRSPLSRQRGVALIELALVLTLLFGVFWGLVVYSFPLVALQSLQRVAAESVRVAGSQNDLGNDEQAYQDAVVARARSEAQRQIAWLAPWLPTLAIQTVMEGSPDCPLARPLCVLRVDLKVDDYPQVAPLKPLVLPGIGQVPALPQRLSASARMLLR